MSKKLILPKWAFEYQHPASEKGDIGAEFRGDDGGCICVYLEKHEGGGICLNTDRSGMSESLFTPSEFAKVVELLTILGKHVKAIKPAPDWLGEALNSGDGTYKP